MNTKKIKKASFFFSLLFLLLTFSAANLGAQTLGDVNGDTQITIVDALMTAQTYVGIVIPNFNAAAGDVDGSGGITILDALMIAQYYVGIIDHFPGGPLVTPDPGGEEPKARFTISDITPSVNQSIIFNASSSDDPDGTIVSYSWDFDDGTTASGIQVTHTFSEIDDFKVVLTVTDNSGLTDDSKERVFVGRPDGWTEDTHHKSADADYDTLFPLTSVPRIDITIASQDFQAMQNNLRTLSMMSDEDPIYVPSTVKFNGYTWWHVGIRYKGQSTLFMPSMSGKKKLPFRLNFDKYEDDYPEIDNQRFYGFSEMTFASNWYDATFVKDVVTAEIFRNAGIPTARNGFARVYIDTGSGPVYWGVYTMIEDPSDQMPKYQFENDEGNMYKPTGTGAEFSSFVQSAYTKKTNKDENDYSDVQAFVSALNASRANAATWRSNLEATFDARSFIKWLAINTSITNFDTYGWVAKNYYLYQDLADNGRLKWIPWDFNLSLAEGDVMGMGFPISIPSLSLSEVRNSWPLIRYLMDDPVYNALYHQEMKKALNTCYDESTVKARIQELHNLVRPYVMEESSQYSFLNNGVSQSDQATTELLNYISSRHAVVASYANSH